MITDLEPRLRSSLVAQEPSDVPPDLITRVAAIPRRVPVRWSDRLRVAAGGSRAWGTPAVRVTRSVVVLVVLLALLVATLAIVGALPSPPRTYLGEFVPTGSMTTPRLGHTATLLNDGRVLITGGSTLSDGAPLASAEVYDLPGGIFTVTGSMTEARAGHAALRLPDGRILVGGAPESGSFDVYDPATGTFAPTGIAHPGALSALLTDGRVLIPTGQGSASIWDPRTGIDTPSKDRAAAGAALHVAIVLPDGKVLITGRDGGFGDDRISVYDPVTDEFQDVEPPDGFTADLALMLDNGRVFLLRQGHGFVYDSAASAFEPIAPPLTGDVPGGYLATRLADGQVLILADHSSAATEIYDPRTDSRAPAGDLVVPRRQPTATTLDDGRVLVAGGSPPGSESAIASAELFQ